MCFILMLKINEIFETIQGEGRYTGIPSVFIRLQGCPVGCPWCDTQHTWAIDPSRRVSDEAMLAKSQDGEQWCEADTQAVLTLLKQQKFTATHIVITGGEPCIYDLTDLTEVLHDNGFTSQIETSGTFAVQCSDKTWVTVSPKINMPGGFEILAQAMQRANEIKHPIAMQKHIDELDNLLTAKPIRSGAEVALQPISQRPRATQLAIKTCIQRNWRLSLQTHKYLGIE
jgi:7-carboxy-7-deazaguanine synthase